MRPAAIVALALLLPGGLAAAQETCRPGRLGSLVCPAPPPKPRPPYLADTQALDRVRRAPDPDAAPVFVPARRTDRLGGTRLPAGAAPAGPCRPDRLGNLVCR